MAGAGRLSENWLASAPPAELEARPLRLRRWKPADAATLLVLINANLAHLRPWMAWAQEAHTLEQQTDFIRRSLAAWERKTDFGYGIWAGAALVGAIGLHQRSGPGTLEIGYWVAGDRTGRGYATGAARAVTEAAFALSGVERVEIRCDEANRASAAVPRKLGYSLVDVYQRQPNAPADSGRAMIWVIDRAGWDLKRS
jgi:RimJ/RimL family protein N-acetyltransferase